MAIYIVAALVYWPLVRLSCVLEKLNFRVHVVPLSFYSKHTFYKMRTEARNRFGTLFEHRFNRVQIELMMLEEGLVDVGFSKAAPYWWVVGLKA